MELNSQICTTRVQSERLLALGLKKETADMYYFWVGGNEYRLKVDVDNNPLKYNMDRTFIPAWPLDRLLKMIPEWISYPTQYDSAPLRINKDSMYYLHRFFDMNGDEDTSTVGDNEAIGSHNI